MACAPAQEYQTQWNFTLGLLPQLTRHCRMGQQHVTLAGQPHVGLAHIERVFVFPHLKILHPPDDFVIARGSGGNFSAGTAGNNRLSIWCIKATIFLRYPK